MRLIWQEKRWLTLACIAIVGVVVAPFLWLKALNLILAAIWISALAESLRGKDEL